MVRDGLTAVPKRLPPWLFYDEAGSRLFEDITELPEYYLTRTERGILARPRPGDDGAGGQRRAPAHCRTGRGLGGKNASAAEGRRRAPRTVIYEPVDVSASALDAARRRIEREIPGVRVAPRVMDYTRGDGRGLELAAGGVRRAALVLYIGSSIGNFEPRTGRAAACDAAARRA